MGTLYVKLGARLLNRSIYGIILLLILGISFALRVSLPYENVFMEDWVRFAAHDPWYHMRLIDNLMQNFPFRIGFDPFTTYPYGQIVPFAPFFDILLGSVIWIIGLGSPSQNVIETVGAYFPAILGALITIPVYFIGRELFSRNAGLLAAGLIAILPGQFFFRSMLGFTDHHVAEVFFSTIAVLFLILALKRAKEKGTSFSHIRNREWKRLSKPLIYALLAGIFLGLYLASWQGGLLFASIIVAYMIIQFIIDHMTGKPTDYLSIIGVPLFLIALITVIPFYDLIVGPDSVISVLLIAMFVPLFLSGVARLMVYRNTKRIYYPLVLACLGVVGFCLIYFAFPSLYDYAVSRITQVFFPSEVAQSIGEVRPLLSATGFAEMIYFFTTGIIFTLIALGLLLYAGIKKRSCERTVLFLIIWCLIMILAMLGQNRFAYYFAVNVALLSGYLCWKILEWSWSYLVESLREPEIRGPVAKYNLLRGAIAYFRFLIYDPKAVDKWMGKPLAGIATGILQPGESTTTEHTGTTYRSMKNLFSVWQGMAGVSIIVFLVAFVPNIAVAMSVTSEVSETNGPNEAWRSSLLWMREYTPDPFEDPDFYYELYEKPPAGESYDYPESAYGVMNFWDYGHWITRIAHRIPNSNPFQSNAVQTAAYFIDQDEASANERMEALGSKYVILDHEMATWKFQTIGIWGGATETQFLDVYDQELAEGLTRSILLYYPEYYRSICSRLYNFDGKAVVPSNSTYVISYEETTSFGMFGPPIKNITSMLTFATYEEAQEFVESQTEPNYRIVGMDPFTSPVPLEELEHYRLIHQSDPEVFTDKETGKKDQPISYVKIFEYIP
jgi:dolichyl-diphosphooligosaccharide--protein glycosyltransferase